MLTRRVFLSCAGAAMAWLGRGIAQAPLRLGFLPTERAPDLIRRFRPFADTVARTLDRAVSVEVATDYAAAVEALRFGHVDFALLGPAAYLMLAHRATVRPVVRPARGIEDTFLAAIIARADGPADLPALRGQSFAFGDVASTSGHVVPRHMLTMAGLEVQRDYQASWLGGHDAVILAVARGHAAAGAVSLPVLRSLEAAGRIAPDSLSIIATSEPIPTYPWVAAPSQPDAVIDEFERCLLDMREPDALDPFDADRFVRARHEDFAEVELALRGIGFLD